FEQTTYLRPHEQPMSARTAAMGGASDALGTDTSDFAANPALIASLKTLSFAFSGVQSGYDVSRYELAPDNLTINRVHLGRDAQSLAHVSVAVPVRNFVFGAYYRDEPRLRDNDVRPAPGSDPYTLFCDPSSCFYYLDIDAVAFDRRERRYGATAAFERGAWSFGAGVELQDLDESHDLVAYQYTNVLEGRTDLFMRRTSGQAWVPNAGVRWRISPRVAVAAAYNGGGTFDRTEDRCAVERATATCTSEYEATARARAERPSAYRASITVMPVDRFTLSAQAVRVNYSQSGVATSFGPSLVDYRFVDATDVHLGAEYRFTRVPVSLRAGLWRESAFSEGSAYEPIGAMDHHTIGAGIHFGGARLDVAYDDAQSARRTTVGITWTR
ncbi:MAG TPA: hypothetical protein VF608_02345, partial [Thermoanaerobaculia bacterium]